MIDLYFWPTPNGQKIPIMLEECGLEYRVKPVNMLRGEQFKPAFLRINPNNKIPAIVDQDGPGASRSRCSSRARSCNTSARKPGGSCRESDVPATRCCSG